MEALSEEITINLPVLHPKQVECFNASLQNRFLAIRAGRRWGKNVFGESLAADYIIDGYLIGWFAPEYKRLSESYENIAEMVDPVKTRSSKQDGVIRTHNQGRVDFWSLDDENAGRGRKYHYAVVDEAAFTKNKVTLETWERAIKPTLVDYNGRAIVMSNTNGIDPENFFWQICNEPRHGFAVFHAPTTSNPHLPKMLRGETEEQWMVRRAEFFKELRESTAPLVFQQEYLAEFVDWSGASFFTRDSLLLNGKPVELPTRCDGVYAVIDSATKTGKDNDGTGVMYFAMASHLPSPLVILDWDLQQIEGDLLINWLPSVFQNLEHLAKACRARMGSMGVFIEDKASGMILLQQARRRGMPAQPIKSKLTEVGKDERAISVSGYIHSGKVKMARLAYDKTTQYKGATRNHALGQVVGFRVGSKSAGRDDDLFDCFTYGTALALGDGAGF